MKKITLTLNTCVEKEERNINDRASPKVNVHVNKGRKKGIEIFEQ